ncbi:MAG: sulfatase-like hydrolase/transferase [Pirellulales bacterium]|nr:sulfatase-like hydrolase/transferase [Pirellulales bacterium]
MPNAVVIAIDGLRASALGAYGNSWYPTPAMDELASQAQVLDWMWCPGPDLAQFYAACWRLGEASTPPTGSEQRDSRGTGDSSLATPGDSATLPRLLIASGVQPVVLTDVPEIAALAERVAFNDVRLLELSSSSTAQTVEQTELARLFAVAADELAQWGAGHSAAEPRNGRLLWLHARGLHGRWDAPAELREQLREEGDPPAATFLQPPAAVQVKDHDELLAYRAAYAAQARVLDECLGGLLTALDEFQLAVSTLVVLVGCRGFALGEHGAVGSDVRSLYSELLHIPCLVRDPRAYPPPRCPHLVGPELVLAMLHNWHQLGGDTSPAIDASLRPWKCAAGDDGERAIRTPAWMLRQSPRLAAEASGVTAARQLELYVKPDDRWEVNEVADRCGDVASRLLAALDQAAPCSGSALPAQAIVLDDDLIKPAR